MEGVVSFYNDQVGWYHAYNNDAVVVSHVMGYQLFKRNGNEYAIGFPEEYLKKVTKNLSFYNIGFNINGEIIKYANSRYDECLKKDFSQMFTDCKLPCNSIVKEVIRGKFIIQYNDEEPIEKEIGINVNEDADIVKFVANNDVGNCYKYGDDIVKIISKSIKIDKIDILF